MEMKRVLESGGYAVLRFVDRLNQIGQKGFEHEQKRNAGYFYLAPMQNRKPICCSQTHNGFLPVLIRKEPW